MIVRYSTEEELNRAGCILALKKGTKKRNMKKRKEKKENHVFDFLVLSN